MGPAPSGREMTAAVNATDRPRQEGRQEGRRGARWGARWGAKTPHWRPPIVLGNAVSGKGPPMVNRTRLDTVGSRALCLDLEATNAS